jgi:mevalonate kinase
MNEELEPEKEIKFTICSSSGGKVIISGEHSVVYGKPALAFGIDKHTKMHLTCYKSNPISKCFALINLFSIQINISISKEEIIHYLKDDIKILDNKNKLLNDIENKHKYHIMEIIKNIYYQIQKTVNFEKFVNFIENNYFLVSISSDIPVGFGLGSSAAYNVCIVNGICLLINKLLNNNIFNKKDILLLSNESEKIFHNGTPSGIDASCSLFGGIILFNSIHNQKNIKIPLNNFFIEKINFILINTKIQRNAGEFIKNVSNFKKNNSKLFTDIINEIGEVTNDITELIMKDKSNEDDCNKFFELIKRNQKLLKKICVSNDEIDKIIDLLEINGYIGKISGAGGGGFIICFVLKEKIKEVENLLKENDIDYINVNISNEPANLINYKIYKL